MNLSNSGRVVLIDDDDKEVKPLMELLGKYSVPYFYYDGSLRNLPEKHLSGVRFVFLDIVLAGMEGRDDETILSTLLHVLKKIIDKDNGPFVIIFWSKRREIIDKVIENCKTSSIPPVTYLDIEKSECKNDAGEYDIDKITQKLKEKLASISAFSLYIEWENIVNQSSKELVKKFSSLAYPEADLDKSNTTPIKPEADLDKSDTPIKPDADSDKSDTTPIKPDAGSARADVTPINPEPNWIKWSKATSSLFYHLYGAYVEENIIDSNEDKFKTACYLMNRSYNDILDSNITKDLKLPEGFEIDGLPITTEVKAKLNTALFLIMHKLPQILPGCVAKITKEEIEEKFLIALKNSLFKKSPDNFDDIIFCKIMITPSCDIAQKKLLKLNSSSVLHRVIYGLLYKSKYIFKITEKTLKGLALADKAKLKDLSGTEYGEHDLISEIKKLGFPEKDIHIILDNTKIKISNFEACKKDYIYTIGPIYFQDEIYNLTFNFLTLTAEKFLPANEDTLFNLQTDLLFDLQSKAANHLNRLGNFILKVKVED